MQPVKHRPGAAGDLSRTGDAVNRREPGPNDQKGWNRGKSRPLPGAGFFYGGGGNLHHELEICAGGVVFKEGKIVVLKRKNGVWLMPKGHVEPGETLEQAGAREATEETGLAVRIGPKLGETAYSHSEDGRYHRKKVHWYYMESDGGELRPEEGIFIEARLVAEEEIQILSFSGDRDIAERAFAVKAAKE